MHLLVTQVKDGWPMCPQLDMEGLEKLVASCFKFPLSPCNENGFKIVFLTTTT